MTASGGLLVSEEGRFARLEAISWWDAARVRDARILVVGAGALGNEVVKNLALLGVGHLVVIDRDVVERTNLCRSVLFRESDEGKPKAHAAARAARELSPGLDVTPLHADLIAGLGLGRVRWADVVVGALDNREARVFLNAACARSGRPWVDGGIDVLSGIVRVFFPPATACYECTMSEVDWKLLDERRSCSLLARRAVASHGTPTTPTSASVVGALQAQEALKLLHGLPALLGRGFIFEGLGHSSYATSYPIRPDCPWHEPPPEVERVPGGDAMPLSEILALAERRLTGLDALEFSREVVEEMECPSCRSREPVRKVAELVTEEEALCGCGAERVPRFVHALQPGSPLLSLTATELGLPRRDVLFGRRGERVLGLELAP